MDFLGLVWVASFLNQHPPALASVIGPEESIGRFAEGFSLETALDQSTARQTLLLALVEPQENPAKAAFLFPDGVDAFPATRPAPSLSLPDSPELEGAFSFPGLTEFTLSAADGQAVPVPVAGDLAHTVLPIGFQLDTDLDVSEAFLTPRLPKLSEDVVNWAAWHSVADVAVVPIKDKSQPKAKPDFLKLREQCPAFPSWFEGVKAKATQDVSSKTRYQIWVHDVPIGEVKTAESAHRIAGSLRQLLQVEDWQPSRLKPLLGKSFAAGRVGDEILFVVDESMLPSAATSSAFVASQWINNLRVAFGENPLELSDVQMVAYGLRETRNRIEGTASWYGPYFHGRKTATGEIFNQHNLTAAHPSLPFGTYLKVRNQLNGKTIVVRVNDRGPYVGKRSLDLSYAAAQCLGSEKVGVIPYEATILKPGIPAKWEGSLMARLDR